MLIKPNPNLLEPLKSRVVYTIECLKLNEEMRQLGRSDQLIKYCKKDYSFDHLKENYPFIAYELERQGLIEVDKIAKIMGVR
jgi:predicted nucleotidyltransferase